MNEFIYNGVRIPINQKKHTSSLVGLQAEPDAAENLNVDELLKKAVINNDITKETADELKKNYKNAPQKLQTLLHDLAKMRIGYLMGLEWDELDKKGLLQELKQKYLQGYQQKFYSKFGKDDKSVLEQKKVDSTGIEPEIKRLKEFAISNGDLEPKVAQMMENNFKNNPEELKKMFQEAPQKRIDSLMKLDFGELDKEGLLEELKRKYLQGFKQKFKAKFGIDYKENK